MAHLIETPEQEIQHLIGNLVWENIALKHEVERLRQALRSTMQQEKQQEKPQESTV